MGQFSWLYSDTGKQMINGRYKASYLLIPEPFVNVYGTTFSKIVTMVTAILVVMIFMIWLHYGTKTTLILLPLNRIP